MDRLSIRNMMFYGYHGAFAAERELGQRFEVDVDLFLDLSRAGRTDDIETSINYVDIYTIVKSIVEEKELNLIEGIAENIATELLSAYNIESVTVRVRKPHAPVGGLFGCVEVEIDRGKPSEV